ncbi:hypothetical protein [Bradyrhizobium sp. BR 1432]|uniref:hypothetical protein n=1 Tax=Bradyrhizobium sp. BR 1432 TaxID=3447966 RepID=UPI003EE4BE38
MDENTQAVQALANTLEHLGAPYSLPEDWIIRCDNDDLRHMPRTAAKRLLAKAKKETARLWLFGRFDPADMELELFDESECDDVNEVFDDRLLKQRAINSIDDVVSPSMACAIAKQAVFIPDGMFIGASKRVELLVRIDSNPAETIFVQAGTNGRALFISPAAKFHAAAARQRQAVFTSKRIPETSK